MKNISCLLLLASALSLTACGQAGQQWLDPDKTFASLGGPDVKSVSETQEQMAKEAAASGDWARASQNYQQLVDSKKGTPDDILRYKMGWADATRRSGDNQTALAMYEELHAQNPNNLDVAEGRGLTLMATGKIPEAGRAFSDVIEKDPKRWRSLNALGILFVTKNMIPEAMQYYTEALNQSPDNPAVLNNMGLSQAADRNYPRAIQALQQALRVSKTPAQRKQIDMNLALVYGVSGDLDTAHDIAAKYYEGPALDNNLGLYAHLAKDDSLAKTYFNMALAQSPTFYQRAWENLDAVNDDDQHGDAEANKSAAKSLPKTDALSAATPAPVRKKVCNKQHKCHYETEKPAPAPTLKPQPLSSPAKSTASEAPKTLVAPPVKDDTSKPDDKKPDAADDKKTDSNDEKKSDSDARITPPENGKADDPSSNEKKTDDKKADDSKPADKTTDDKKSEDKKSDDSKADDKKPEIVKPTND